MDDPRVHEVIVHIGYQTDHFQGDDLLELRDYTEAIVAREFQVEQARVEMRVRPYGPLDDYEEPLFIRIIAQIDLDPVVYKLAAQAQELASQDLAAQIKEHFHTSFFLWVEFAPATFTEVTDKRGTE